MTCDDLKLSLYLDGELAERDEMERHLAKCARCRARIEELRRADWLLAEAADRMAPPAARRRRWWRIPAVAAAVLLVAAATGLVWVNLQTADPQEVRVVAGDVWFAGSTSRARVVVTDERGQKPVAGATVKGRLQVASRAFEASAKSGPDGSAELAFELPPDLEGNGSLTVEVSSHIDSDTMTGTIRVERPGRVLLTTDKPIYQPTQEIHIRALAMNNFAMKPLAKTQAVIEIEDPNGTKVFKREGTTSDFGIFAADFRLADEVILGRWRIRSRVGKLESERTVEVSRYVLPKFSVTLKTDSDFYAPGDTIRGTVEARYFFPQPVAGGKVEVTGTERMAGTLDPNGRWTFESRAPDREGDLRVEVSVIDGTGHAERKSVRVPISRAPIVIDVVPVFGEVVGGIDNALYVVTTYPDGRPARCRIGTVETDSAGVAVLSIGRSFEPVRIEARDSAGRAASIIYEPGSHVAERDFALLVDSSCRAGETLTVAALAARDMTLYIDLVKNDQTILTKTLDVRGGRGTLAIDLPTELSGAIRLSAYRVREDGDFARDSRLLLVDLPSDLVIRPVPSKSEYRPGEEIAVDFEVLDSKGNPVVSAITLAVVDEAVFALAEARPGLEREFFRIVEDLLKPRYQVKTADPRVRAANAASPEPRFVCGCTRQSKQRAVDRWIARYNDFAKGAAVVVGILGILTLVLGAFVWAVREAVRGRPAWLIAECIGAGILLSFGVATPGFLKSQRAGMDMKSGAPGDARATVWSNAPYGIHGTSPRLREFFPETLYWNSEIVTDEQGRARVTFRGADSITTWRMTMSAVSRDGRLGSATGGITVFQPFFVDIDLPVALTEGDELWVPIAVYNFSDKRDTVTLTFTAEPGIELLDPAEQKLDVEPNRTASVLYHVRAAKFGTHRLEVLAKASSFGDRVARTIEVSPDGKAVPFAAGDRLKQRTTLRMVIPAESIDGAHRAWVRLFPSSFSEIVTGLDALVRMPYG